MTRFGGTTLLYLAAACSAGCGSGSPDVARSQVTRDRAYYVTYKPLPNPIQVAQPFELKVAVFQNAERSKPVTDAQLAVTGWMPEHEHGMYTTPTVVSNVDGTYSVHGMLFHMEMHWEIRMDVTRGAVTDRAVFNVICCEK